MFRASLQHSLRKPLLCSSIGKTQSARKQSTSSSSGGKTLVVLGGAAVTVIGGSVLGAKYSNDFRNTLENTIPYSDVALNKILGPKETAKPVSKSDAKSLPSKESATKVEDSLLKKKLERESKNQTPLTLPPPPLSPPLSTPAKTPEKSTADQKVTQTPTTAKDVNNNQPQVLNTKKVVESTDTSKNEPKEKLPKDETIKKDIDNIEAEVESRVVKELAKRKGELENTYKRKMTSLQDSLEEEIRQQLKRQLAAHVDHLREQLEVQKNDLERKYSIILEEKILEEKSHYASELIQNLSRLKEVETVLKNRQQLDVDERKARELWLICEVLRDSLKSKRVQSDREPVSLAKDFNEIRQTVKSMQTTNTLTSTVLDSVTESSLQNGIYTEDDLIDRFNKIEKMCKRVALIGDEGGSISRYLLSYLQSVLVFDQTVSYCDEVNGNKSIDPSMWDTYDILSRVRYCLSERNLEMSLKYANQLKGKPRQIAKDWINDLRVHLEIRQVADILQAQAASFTVRAVK